MTVPVLWYLDQEDDYAKCIQISVPYSTRRMGGLQGKNSPALFFCPSLLLCLCHRYYCGMVKQ